MPLSPVVKAETRLTFKRSGFAAILFAIVRPRDAKAAAVNEKTLTLTFTFRSIGVPLEDIKMVMLGRRWSWRAVRIRYSNRESVVSGLARGDAKTLCQTLESAKVFWWRKALAAQDGALHAVHGRLAQLADPPSYTTHRIQWHFLVRVFRPNADPDFVDGKTGRRISLDRWARFC